MVQALLQLGADPNAQPGDDGTALLAEIRGPDAVNLRICELILSTDVKESIDIGHVNEGNPLQLASARGDLDIVTCLLDAGADVNATHLLIGDALQAASVAGHESIVRLLLERGADANKVQGAFGSAYLAAVSGDSESHTRIATTLKPISTLTSTDGFLWHDALCEAISTTSHWDKLREDFGVEQLTFSMLLQYQFLHGKRMPWKSGLSDGQLAYLTVYRGTCSPRLHKQSNTK